MARNSRGLVSLFFLGSPAACSRICSMKLSSETLIRLGTLLCLAGLSSWPCPYLPYWPLPPCASGIGLAHLPVYAHLTPVYFNGRSPRLPWACRWPFVYRHYFDATPLWATVRSYFLPPNALHPLVLRGGHAGLHYPARGTRGEEPPSCRGSHLLGPEIAIEHSLDRLPACNHALVGNKIAGVMQFVNGTRLACPKEEQRSWNLLEEIGHILPNKAA